MSGRTIVKRVLIGVVASVALVYFGDSLSVWYRTSKKIAGDPLTTITTQPIIEIPHKDGRAEIVLGQPDTQTCVRALFPHDGYNPCWYVARQNQAPIVMTMLLFLRAAGWKVPRVRAAAYGRGDSRRVILVTKSRGPRNESPAKFVQSTNAK